MISFIIRDIVPGRAVTEATKTELSIADTGQFTPKVEGCSVLKNLMASEASKSQLNNGV